MARSRSEQDRELADLGDECELKPSPLTSRWTLTCYSELSVHFSRRSSYVKRFVEALGETIYSTSLRAGCSCAERHMRLILYKASTPATASMAPRTPPTATFSAPEAGCEADPLGAVPVAVWLPPPPPPPPTAPVG